MRPLDALRDRLEGTPPVRAAVLAEARAVFPDLPRDADAARLVRYAHRLMQDAACDEFAREGAELVDLPEGWGRAELRRADIAADAGFIAFVEEVDRAVEIGPSALDRDDARALRDSPFAADGYGLSLETCADLASWLLGRAWVLQRAEQAEALEQDDSVPRRLPAVAEDLAGDEDEFFAQQEQLIREGIRERLARLVRVPLELRAAMERHERVQSRALAARHQVDEPAAEAGRTVRDDLVDRASGVVRRARAEAGRTAAGILREGAGRAYGRYGRREHRDR